jgi:hypothetical protein
MLLQMSRLLEAPATLLAVMADLFAGSAISTFLVILQTNIHFILKNRNIIPITKETHI